MVAECIVPRDLGTFANSFGNMNTKRHLPLFAALAALAAFAPPATADDVPRICPACDHEVAYDEAFCHYCGGDLSGVPVPGAAEPDPEPEMPGSGAVAEAIRADVVAHKNGIEGHVSEIHRGLHIAC